MAKYKKKPVTIEAFRLGFDFPPDWFWSEIENNFIDLIYNGDIYSKDIKVEIKTLEGIMTGNRGDYIIQGVKGECYPCKPDIFEETYEKVED